MKCLELNCPRDASIGIYCKIHANKSGGTTYFHYEDSHPPRHQATERPDTKKQEKHKEQ